MSCSLNKDDFVVDFNDGKFLRRFKNASKKSEVLLKVIAIKGKNNLAIIDATAGFGTDSAIMVAGGHRVKAFEKNKTIYEILKNAMAASDIEFELYNEDFVSANIQGSVDVVYLDPMFPSRGKKALPKLKMQIIQELADEEFDEEALFEKAKALAAQKIVVKRHAKSSFLAGKKPSYSLSEKICRFDVYVIPK